MVSDGRPHFKHIVQVDYEKPFIYLSYICEGEEKETFYLT